jgi:hypothetical protein
MWSAKDTGSSSWPTRDLWNDGESTWERDATNIDHDRGRTYARRMSKVGQRGNAYSLRLVLAAGTIAIVCCSHARAAQACSLAVPTPHTLDPAAQATDTTPPEGPTAAVTSIRRGKGADTDFASCSQSASSCDDLGWIALQLGAQDDQTPADKLGYQIELIAGQPPSGLNLPTGAVRAMGGMVYLNWNDGASDDQESISFSLAVRAVDLAGNTRPATTVNVSDGGSVLPGPLSAWPITTLSLLLLARLLRGLKRT